ncbi:MAG TPA: SDR family oxidoreductase [Gemmatimonadaceae bacterium]|nr:SDR family oxidoreductase [Gemmatimonadaceae bacterium]
MILIVGATGNLGGFVARQLIAKGHPVRAMTRDRTRATALEAIGAEVVTGDLRDPESLRAATRGARAVVSASHSILGAGKSSSAHVDDEGQRALIAAAKEAGVAHFIFTSIMDAAANHPVDFWRTKDKIEKHLESSGLRYTIVRPSAFMEIHAYELLGKAVMAGKRVMMFGPGNNPRNFVASEDVAKLIVRALEDVSFRGKTIPIGGPENLTDNQVVEVFERVAGRTASVTHIPLPFLKAISGVVQAFHPGVSRIIKSGIANETTDQTFDYRTVPSEYSVELTKLEDWARSRAQA